MLLYAVVPADATAPDTRGIFGRQLETIRGALVTVLVEESFEPPRATSDESQAFAKIICDLAMTTPMLPIRFPTMLTTRSAVLAELQSNEAAWHRRLTELDGLSEVVVRAQWPVMKDVGDSPTLAIRLERDRYPACHPPAACRLTRRGRAGAARLLRGAGQVVRRLAPSARLVGS
jgi:hypothetical protein